SLSRVRRPPLPTLFPYTTLFRSGHEEERHDHVAGRPVAEPRTPAAATTAATVGLSSASRSAAAAAAAATSFVGSDACQEHHEREDRKSTRLNSSHDQISYAVFCL